jgi:hypothetical protein
MRAGDDQGSNRGRGKIDLSQYTETNVMHFLFSLIRIKGLCMFGALLAHHQEALQSCSWYIACVLLSVGSAS